MIVDKILSSRLGIGLLGVTLLALVGGIGGTLAYSTFGGGTLIHKPSETLDADNTIDIVVTPGTGEPSGTGERVDGPERIPAEITHTPESPSATKPLDRDTDVPSKKPGPPTDRILEQAAFIVRFADQSEINDYLQLYRKDKQASRDAFAKWALQHPELSGMTLEHVNYSGEAILLYDGTVDENPVSNAKQIQSRLNALAFVRYADPDYTAFPGKKGE